jgi:hypothetical protein
MEVEILPWSCHLAHPNLEIHTPQSTFEIIGPTPLGPSALRYQV